MKFPVLAIHPKRFTWLFHTEAETRRVPVGFIDIYKKKKDAMDFFDSEGVVWKLESIEPVKHIPFLFRIFSGARMTDAVMRFQSLGQCPLDRMKDVFGKAVKADDDILTQHQEREEILTKLADTKSVGEIFRLYRWMMKDFRKGPNQTPQTTRPFGPRV